MFTLTIMNKNTGATYIMDAKDRTSLISQGLDAITQDYINMKEEFTSGLKQKHSLLKTIEIISNDAVAKRIVLNRWGKLLLNQITVKQKVRSN
ncbi:hypothetical protein [Bacillus phage Nachito]|nr:hypothetical protein [Bacillus phage Nachito]